jgi:HAD superfamily hydrolase (TIGR01509 family)
MQVKAVIFDLDGLMLETEAIARDIWLSEAQKQGVPLSKTLYDSLIGRTYPDIHDLVQNAFGDKADATKFIADCLARYKERIHQPIPQRPGLERMLDWCDEKGLKKVVGTSSGREFALVKLASAGIAYRFDAMVTGSDVEKGKPAPDVFLKAAKKAGEKTENCLVLEDSANGILAAKAAGIFSIMIPDLIVPSPEIRAKAGAVLESLAEVPAYLASRGMVD